MRFGGRLIAAVCALAALAALAPGALAACTLEGDGSGAHPYLVATKAQLLQVGTDCALTANYKQTADITWTRGTFTPIADSGMGMGGRFEGAYDGGGHAIIGLRIDATADREAMFANVDDATIEHLELRDAVVVADGMFSGILIAYTSADAGPVHIRDVRITGASSVTSSGDTVGAIVGLGQDDGYGGTHPLTIADVASTAAVTGASNVGGIAGYLDIGAADSVLRRASSTGAVHATLDSAGGLIGRISVARDGAYLADAYARGAVTADHDYAAGAIAVWDTPVAPPASGTVRRVYATGAVSTPGAHAAGLSIYAFGDASDDFFDTETTGRDDLSDSARTTAQMKDIATYGDAGWGIALEWATPSDLTVWGICPLVNDGYPFLLSAYESPGPCARETIGMKVVRTFVGRGGLAHAPAPRASLRSGVAVRWRRPSDAPVGTTYTVTWRVNGVDRSVDVGTRTSARLTVGNTGEVDVSVESSHGNRSARLLLPASVFRQPAYAACSGPWQALCANVGTRYRMGKVRQVATFLRSGTRSASVICRAAAPARAGGTRTVCRLSRVGKALLRRGPIVVRMTTTLVIGPITFVDSALVAIPRSAGS